MQKAPFFPASFVGADHGAWRVTSMTCVAGAPLPPVAALDVVEAHLPAPVAWILRGTGMHARYTNRAELDDLAARKPLLGRPEATHAALIPIRKNDAWWLLAQDERRQIMEEESHHIAMSIGYLPQIARRLYHCRELAEPFDFLTWFEFAPAHTALFDTLVEKLRATREWDFVDREVDIRLARA